MAEANPMEDLLGSHKSKAKGGDRAALVVKRIETDDGQQAPPESTATSGDPGAGGQQARSETSRSRTPRSQPARRRSAQTASKFPRDWVPTTISVPVETTQRAWTQMRPNRVGLERGEGKTPGKQYNFAIKAIAADRILGDTLDTSGFVYGNEADAIKVTEDAIIAAAEKILESRAS